MIDSASEPPKKDSPKKAPWDQRLLGSMAQESWEAANHPAGGLPKSTLRERSRSPYFWLQIPAAAGALIALDVIKTGWADALAAVLYIACLSAGLLAKRDARALRLLRESTKEQS